MNITAGTSFDKKLTAGESADLEIWLQSIVPVPFLHVCPSILVHAGMQVLLAGESAQAT